MLNAKTCWPCDWPLCAKGNCCALEEFSVSGLAWQHSSELSCSSGWARFGNSASSGQHRQGRGLPAPGPAGGVWRAAASWTERPAPVWPDCPPHPSLGLSKAYWSWISSSASSTGKGIPPAPRAAVALWPLLRTPQTCRTRPPAAGASACGGWPCGPPPGSDPCCGKGPCGQEERSPESRSCSPELDFHSESQHLLSWWSCAWDSRTWTSPRRSLPGWSSSPSRGRTRRWRGRPFCSFSLNTGEKKLQLTK